MGMIFPEFLHVGKSLYPLSLKDHFPRSLVPIYFLEHLKYGILSSCGISVTVKKLTMIQFSILYKS